MTEANAARVAWDARGTAQSDRLTALISLHTANRPATQHSIGHTSFVEEVFAFPDGEFVDISNYEVVRQILVAERNVLSRIVRILTCTALVECCKEWQGSVGVRQRLGPCVRSK